ncbi:hypothetical protein LTR15_007770 [Elasticomyces elasticus]|nr:hypothetical protein LTR15_007770 [Elasticomyces elasticus]
MLELLRDKRYRELHSVKFERDEAFTLRDGADEAGWELSTVSESSAVDPYSEADVVNTLAQFLGPVSEGPSSTSPVKA